MRQPNPVPAVSQQRQQFQLGQLQPQVPDSPRPVDDLAMEIYARLVAGQYLDSGYTSALDESHLRQLASDAQAAAGAYFAVRENQERENNG